ncbi:unnamed protein product [Symbiodinium sp. CCMP2592]|nr:unnamed protein product [Symbiodinium sp. CCMP2592]
MAEHLEANLAMEEDAAIAALLALHPSQLYRLRSMVARATDAAINGGLRSMVARATDAAIDGGAGGGTAEAASPLLHSESLSELLAAAAPTGAAPSSLPAAAPTATAASVAVATPAAVESRKVRKGNQERKRARAESPVCLDKT